MRLRKGGRQREPGTLQEPTDLTRGEWIAVLKAAKNQAQRDDISSLAAGVAYRIFLSLFPVLIAAVAIFSLVVSSTELEHDLTAAQGVIPDQARAIIENQLEAGGEAAGSIAVVAILVGLLAALAAAQAIMKALNRAYNVEESRGFIEQRVIALLLTLALFLALVGLVVVLVFGPQIVGAIVPAVLLRNGLGVLITLGRYVAAMAVLVVLFAFIYAVGPDRPAPRWTWMSPGAILGVIGWLVVSYGFSVYTRIAPSYNEGGVYGTFAGVIVMLIWLQLTMLILLFGAELDAELERAREQAAGLGEAPLPPPQAITLTEAGNQDQPPGAQPDVPSTSRSGKVIGSLALLVAAFTRRKQRG